MNTQRDREKQRKSKQRAIWIDKKISDAVVEAAQSDPVLESRSMEQIINRVLQRYVDEHTKNESNERIRSDD